MITISLNHMHDLTIVNIQYAKHATYMYFDIAYCVYDNYGFNRTDRGLIYQLCDLESGSFTVQTGTPWWIIIHYWRESHQVTLKCVYCVFIA